jgi:hypothetical protein
LEENPTEHIGTTELASLLEESRRRPESVDPANVHPHLGVCPTCREQFEALALLDRQLRSMALAESGLQPGAQRDCPAAAAWREMAGGLVPPEQTLSLIEHASRCDHCGRLLREAVAELSALHGETTEAERKHIATLESASAAWQQKLAQRITGTPQARVVKSESARWGQRWFAVAGFANRRLTMAGASLLAVVAAGSWVVVHRNDYRNQPADARQLLARAYTEKRTLELRIAGANYAPLRVSRGPAASFTSRPAALLKAEALIAGQLESHPADPAWLQAQAQADVLEGKYDAGVEALRRALELEPHSPAILTDLATAYFQRAQQEDRKDDFGAAYEHLSLALKYRPDDPVALFNRAIVAEHQFLYHQALDDWDRYLQVDPGSEWASEAHAAAERIRAKLKDHDTSQAVPLLTPQQIAAATDDPNLRTTVDARIEEYLSGAVRSWLRQAYPEQADRDRNTARAAQRALFFLADLTSQQPNDHWLSDLLSGSAAQNFPQAVGALARAAQANEAGEYSTTNVQAPQAERLFRASGNEAGKLRAQFEQTFAAQIERHSEQCRRRSIAVGAESRRYAYPWLQVQLGLEESVCSGLMGDLGTYEQAARRAQDRAQRAGYGGLYLRALGFVADIRFETGDRANGWKLVCAGLERYWSGQFPARPGYNLYYEMAYPAEAGGQSSLQEAIWREAVAMIDADEDLPLRAWAHSSMANAAHQPDVAKREYGEAARLYGLAPQTGDNRTYRVGSEIRTAQLEARQSAFEDALVRLTRVQDEVRELSDNYLAQIFYSTLGEVQLGGHHDAAAEQAFRPAMGLAEQNLASLSSEADRTRWSKDAAPIYLGLAEAELVQGRERESLDVFEWYLGAPQRVGTRGRATAQQAPAPPQSLP